MQKKIDIENIANRDLQEINLKLKTNLIEVKMQLFERNLHGNIIPSENRNTNLRVTKPSFMK